MKKKLLVAALGFSSSILLAGCGGGDSDDGSGEVKTLTSVFYNVKVIDGYLKNAQVWLDINGNKQLDKNEPSAFSGDGGVAKLDVTDVVNPDQHSIYAKIIGGQTVDEDSGIPVAFDYMMSAPPGEQEITPLSTLVNIVIEQNTDGSETAEQLAIVKQAAVIKIANDFGIAEGDVLSDFIESSSASTAYVAENIVSSKILPDNENEFILVTADGSANATTFNKVVAVVSDRIENIVKATAEEDFAGIGGVFDSFNDSDLTDDNDADGVPNAFDDLRDDASDWLDYDGDLIGNIIDDDDDGDGIKDSQDADPLDPTVGQFDDCIINFTEGASSDDFNAQLAICDRLPEMALADNSILRIQDGKTDTYSFNAGDAAAWYQNGAQHNRIWAINNDGNLALSSANGEILEYLMRLIDNSTEELKFAVYSDQSKKIWTTTYKDVDVSVDILACEDLTSGWDDINDVPLTYRSYDEFKQAVASCQEGKLFNKLSTGFIGQGKTLTTTNALSQAEDVDTYQFNENGSGVFTYNEGVGDIIVPMTWTIFEEGIIKVVFNYTDDNGDAQIAHDYLAIVETNGIDFSVKVFSRSTALQGLGDTAPGDIWSSVLKVPDTD